MKKPLGIYVHIPFCIRKCLYCDFLSFPAEETVKESYIKALLEEIEAAPVKFSFDPSEYEVKTIYIGGGTPSCVNEIYINKILCKLNETFFYKKQVSPEKTEDLNITQNRNKAEAEKVFKEKRKSLAAQRNTVGKINLYATQMHGITPMGQAEAAFLDKKK